MRAAFLILAVLGAIALVAYFTRPERWHGSFPAPTFAYCVQNGVIVDNHCKLGAIRK